MVLSLVFRALDDGAPVVIDELDASLHTLASEAVVLLFCSKKTNPKGAQLIATTHDTNLLDSTDAATRSSLVHGKGRVWNDVTISPDGDSNA